MLKTSCERLAAAILGVSGFRSCIAQPLLVPAARHSSVGQSSTPASSSRGLSEAAGGDAYIQEVDAINEKFAEAREEIEYAREDAETVYFNESAEEARKAVADVLGRWQTLLDRLAPDEQAKLQRSMGLKIEQLKAELKELDELHA